MSVILAFLAIPVIAVLLANAGTICEALREFLGEK
jgi:hypothetical protein